MAIHHPPRLAQAEPVPGSSTTPPPGLTKSQRASTLRAVALAGATVAVRIEGKHIRDPASRLQRFPLFQTASHRAERGARPAATSAVPAVDARGIQPLRRGQRGRRWPGPAGRRWRRRTVRAGALPARPRRAPPGSRYSPWACTRHRRPPSAASGLSPAPVSARTTCDVPGWGWPAKGIS